MHFRPRRLSWLVVVSLWLIPVSVAAQAAPASAPEIRFAPLDAARQAFLDETIEPYFSLLQPIEMTAKTGAEITGDSLAAQRDECRKRYAAAVGEFTDAEQQALTWFIEQLDPAMRRNYPRFANTPWSFLKVDSRIEGGLPHTRGHSIVFAPEVVADFVQVHQSRPGLRFVMQLQELLLHEQMHVVQRVHPRVWEKMYREVWGFEHVESIEEGAWLTRQHLANPDGVDTRWIFPVDAKKTQWIMPIVVFREAAGVLRMPNDFVMLGVRVTRAGKGWKAVVDAKGKPDARDLLEIPEYTQAFGGSQNIYHPHEAGADLFARIGTWELMEAGVGATDENTKAFQQRYGALQKAFREALRAE